MKSILLFIIKLFFTNVIILQIKNGREMYTYKYEELGTGIVGMTNMIPVIKIKRACIFLNEQSFFKSLVLKTIRKNIGINEIK